MKIYTLTKLGHSLARNPSQNITPGWSVVYYLRRAGGQSSDDQISQVTGIDSGRLGIVMKNLKEKKVVAEIG